MANVHLKSIGQNLVLKEGSTQCCQALRNSKISFDGNANMSNYCTTSSTNIVKTSDSMPVRKDYQDKEQSKQDRLQMVWDEKMVNADKTSPHEKVAVILLSWDAELDDLHTREEVPYCLCYYWSKARLMTSRWLDLNEFSKTDTISKCITSRSTTRRKPRSKLISILPTLYTRRMATVLC